MTRAKKFWSDIEIENKELVDRIDVVDCEVHTTEEMDCITKHIKDEELRELELNGYNLESSVNNAMGTNMWNFFNHKSGTKQGGRPLISTPMRSIEDVDGQQDDIRADVTFVNSLGAILIGGIQNTKKQVAYMRAANRWMKENLSTDHDNYYTGVTINPEHPQESAEEIEKYANNPNVKYVITIAPPGKPFGNKRYEPIFDAAERNDLPIVMHGDAVANEGFLGAMDMDKCFEHRALSQFLGHVRNATSLIGEEIPERYDLTFAFIEHTLSWVPMLMNRLDNEIQVRGYEVPGLTKRPSEYLQEFYYGTQPLEQPQNPAYLGTMLEMCGLEDQIIYTSDYPHADADHVGVIADHDGLTEEQKIKILQDNAREAFDL